MKLVSSFFVWCLLALSLLACTPTSSPPQAQNGVLDLRGWDFEQDGLISLNGEWEFYWAQLLTTDDFTAPTPPVMTSLIKVPASWNGYQVDGQALTGDGYTTYRLHILLSENQLDQHLFAIDTPLPISTAHNFYINKQLIGSDGVVGPTAATMIPQFTPYVATFPAETNQLELVVQVSNFFAYQGGIFQPIYFGPQPHIYAAYHRRLGLNLFLIGSILMMGFYHLGLFWLRKQDKSPLYFGLFCLAISSRAFITDYPAWLGLSWIHFIQLTFLLIYGAVAILVIFTQVLFPQELSKRASGPILGCIAVLVSVVLFASPKVYTFLIPTMIFIALVNTCSP